MALNGMLLHYLSKRLKNSALFACLSRGPNLDYFVTFCTVLNKESLTFQPVFSVLVIRHYWHHFVLL